MERPRDQRGRFTGWARFNVESIPRLPTFPVRWLLEDRRCRQYLVFWTTRDHDIAYPLKLERGRQPDEVIVTSPRGETVRLRIIARTMPRRGVFLLYLCPVCQRPRRYLYRLMLVGNVLVEALRLVCQSCARLQYASRRYRRVLEREIVRACHGGPAREPCPRFPWDPRAVSTPAMIAGEFASAVVSGRLALALRRRWAGRVG